MAEPHSDDYLAAVTVGELRPYAVKVVVEDYNPDWPAWYADDESAIREALGDTVLQIEHTGSTSVPSLPAKPIIDILLLVPDSAAEATYVPHLERVGYTLRIREPEWYEHRLLIRRVEDGAHHNVNLHVHSPKLSAKEITRVLAFRDWLRTHEDDRDLYARTKRELAQRDWKYVQHYADAKTAVIEEILARAMSMDG
jgi:GrpB-like predicted nucleotidyltransferase (UPF0157 family)